VGRRIADIRGASMIVGLRRGEDFRPQPAAETQLEAGDVILAMGSPAVLEQLEGQLDVEPLRR